MEFPAAFLRENGRAAARENLVSTPSLTSPHRRLGSIVAMLTVEKNQDPFCFVKEESKALLIMACHDTGILKLSRASADQPGRFVPCERAGFYCILTLPPSRWGLDEAADPSTWKVVFKSIKDEGYSAVEASARNQTPPPNKNNPPQATRNPGTPRILKLRKS